MLNQAQTPRAAAPVPAPAPSSLANRDYGELTNMERHTLASENPEAFARNRAEWESRGYPNRQQGTPTNSAYETWTNSQRAYCSAHDPERFATARADWIKRGEPSGEPDEAA